MSNPIDEYQTKITVSKFAGATINEQYTHTTYLSGNLRYIGYKQSTNTERSSSPLFSYDAGNDRVQVRITLHPYFDRLIKVGYEDGNRSIIACEGMVGTE